MPFLRGTVNLIVCDGTYTFYMSFQGKFALLRVDNSLGYIPAELAVFGDRLDSGYRHRFPLLLANSHLIGEHLPHESRLLLYVRGEYATLRTHLLQNIFPLLSPSLLDFSACFDVFSGHSCT